MMIVTSIYNAAYFDKNTSHQKVAFLMLLYFVMVVQQIRQ